jgi:hypothetical protein
MTKSTKTVKPSFYEVIFKGSPQAVRGLLTGMALAGQEPQSAFFNFESGVFHEELGEKLAELVHLRHHDCHLIIDGVTATRIKKTAARIQESSGLELVSCRHIRSAEFGFNYSVYARRYDEEIADLLDDLPQGIKLMDFERRERLDPDARGIEAYTPVHDFEADGEGKVRGRVDLLIDVRQQLDRHPLIKAGLIRLNLA